MDVGIVYSSKTGNTERIAKAIASEMKMRPCKVENCKKASFDFVFIGSPIHGMRPVPEIVEFMEHVSAKYAAVFETHAGVGGLEWMEKRLKSRGIPVIGLFSCRGEFNVFGSFVVNKGRPDEQDLEEAKHFARLMKNKLKNPRIRIPEEDEG